MPIPRLLAASLLLVSAIAQDSSESVRRERVMQLAVKADPASCELLEGALTDSSADIRGRAATAIYWNCDRSTSGRRAAMQLCKAADLGTANAGVYLLLGYGPKETVVPCLRKARPAWPMVKLIAASKPLPVSFATRIALARLGDNHALTELRTAFQKNTVDEALFLLSALADVQDPASLSAAVKLLDDVRDCPGVRSNSKRKVRDAAADALIQRFQIVAAGYPLRAFGKRYHPTEIEQVRSAAAASIKP